MKRRHLKYILAGAVALAAFVVFLSSLQNGFVAWDDDAYVYENSHLRSSGITFLKWAFFDFYEANWHPLTWISHALDYAVWGLNPLGHHLTNVILHAINTFLVVLLVMRLMEAGRRLTEMEISPNPSLPKRGTGASPPLEKGDTGGFSYKSALITAAVTGLLFGLHPLHVESVAWVAERKDLLCAFFFLLSIMAYLSYATHRTYKSYKTYFLSLLFFVLALMSKPMAVSLPLVLLILDWYPLERIASLKTARTALLEKVPFFGLSIVSAVLTVLAQRSGEAIQTMEFAPLSTRLLVAAKSLVVYLWKMAAPLDLVPFYPYPKDASLFSAGYLPAIILVVAITITCVLVAGKRKLWPSVWAYYVITLLPVLGIVQVGLQSMADRYTYLPSLGPFLLVGLGTARVWSGTKGLAKWGPVVRSLVAGMAVVVIISFSYLTVKQTAVWKDGLVFWNYVIDRNPGKISIAYFNRGNIFKDMGQFDKSLADYGAAIALSPDYYRAYTNRGTVFSKIGELDKALADYNTAITLAPSKYGAYFNRGNVFQKMGQFDKALADYDKAIALDPSYYQAYANRGVLFEKTGRPERAIADYDSATALEPSYYVPYYNRGIIYARTGASDKAIENFTKAISLNPAIGAAYMNRGVLYARAGNRGLAVSDFQKACELGDQDGCGALQSFMGGQTRY